jgi:hypothetical protein
MRFRVSRSSTVIIDGNAVASQGGVVVSCDRWWDARTIGLMHFGCEVAELWFEQTEEAADVETRWVGSDATDSNRDGRRMEFRRRDGEWRPIEQYNDDRLAAAEAAKMAAQEATP